VLLRAVHGDAGQHGRERGPAEGLGALTLGLIESLASRYGYRVPVTSGLVLAGAALLAMLGAGLGLSISEAA
jgi:hypothetical protein